MVSVRPSRYSMVMGMISRSNLPASWAATALSWLAWANLSESARDMLYTSDSFSAVWPMFMIQGALMLNHWGSSLACLSGYICQLSRFMNSIMTWGLSMDRASPPGSMG